MSEKDKTIDLICTKIDELAGWVADQLVECNMNLDEPPVWWACHYKHVITFLEGLREDDIHEPTK